MVSQADAETCARHRLGKRLGDTMKNGGYIEEGAIRTLLWAILIGGILVGLFLPKLWSWLKPFLLAALQ